MWAVLFPLATLKILSRVTLRISAQQKFTSDFLSILGIWVVILNGHIPLFLHDVRYDVFGAFSSPVLPSVFILGIDLAGVIPIKLLLPQL